MRQAGRIGVRRNLAGGHDSPAVEALHVVGLGHDRTVAGVLGVDMGKYCGSGRSHADIGLQVEEERRNRFGAVHKHHAKEAGKGSTK